MDNAASHCIPAWGHGKWMPGFSLFRWALGVMCMFLTPECSSLEAGVLPGRDRDWSWWLL